MEFANISLNTSVEVIRVPKHVLQENSFRLIQHFISVCTRSREISSEMGEKTLKITALIKKRKNFPFLSVGRNGLPVLSWTQKCECRL